MRSHHPAPLILTIVAGFVRPWPAAGAEKHIGITRIFSDMYFNQEGGDLLGTEIFIVYGGRETGYVAFVQESDGEPGPPMIVPVEANGDKASFTVPAPSLPGVPIPGGSQRRDSTARAPRLSKAAGQKRKRST